MRLLTFAGLCATLACVAFKPADPPESEYCNDRFSFCIPYPSGFTPPEESDNADGAVMRSADGKVEVRAWGHYAAPEDGTDLAGLFETETSGVRVVTSERDSTGFTFTGLDSASGKMVYERTVQHPASDHSASRMVQTIWVSYPAAQAEDYTAYCSVAGRSLR